MITTQATLREKNFLNKAKTLCEFVFELQENIIWKVGQFAMIEIQDKNTPDVKRAYSIANTNNKKQQIKFVIQKVENGRGTTWLFNILKTGETTNIMLPFGHMILNENTENEVFLIGTGIGIAPMFAFVEHFEKHNFPKPVRLIFGARYEDDLCFIEKMNKIAAKNENFTFYPTVSRPSENWKGQIGRANAVLKNLNLDFTKQDAYICGSPTVAKSLQAELEGLGVKNENIKMEAF